MVLFVLQIRPKLIGHVPRCTTQSAPRRTPLLARLILTLGSMAGRSALITPKIVEAFPAVEVADTAQEAAKHMVVVVVVEGSANVEGTLVEAGTGNRGNNSTRKVAALEVSKMVRISDHSVDDRTNNGVLALLKSL